jgi:hypothetical protein
MWKVYEIESYLADVVELVRDTLLNHCDGRLEVKHTEDKTMVFWFNVSEESGEDGSPVVKAEGKIQKGKFRFRSGKDGASFSCAYYDDPEDVFHQFVAQLNFHRRSLRLKPVDIDGLYDIAEAAVPPVKADNYVLFTGADIEDLLALLSGKFAGAAIREICGKYSIVMYAENARITKYFCAKNIPVYQKFLGDFKNLYGFKDPALVYVREGEKQHIFFYVQEKGLFYNKEDSGGVLLEEEHSHLSAVLATTPEYIVRGEKGPPANIDCEFRLQENTYRYVLHVNKHPTEMLIYRATLARSPVPTPIPDMESLVPVGYIWFADGGDQETTRRYETLEAAFQGEMELVQRIYEAGDLPTIIKPMRA